MLKIRLTYPTMMTLGSYTFTKEDPKRYINHVKQHFSSTDSSIFHQKLAIFVMLGIFNT